MVCGHLMGLDNGENAHSPRPELGSLSFSVSLQESSWVLPMTYSLAWAHLVWQLVEATERSLKSVSTPSSSSVWSPMASTSKTCWVCVECEADRMVLSLGGKAWMVCPGQPNVLQASLCVHLEMLSFKSVHWRSVAIMSHRIIHGECWRAHGGQKLKIIPSTDEESVSQRGKMAS